MARHSVGDAADLGEGERLIVELDGRSIGIFNVEGRLYALRNRCPHQGGPVCEGLVTWALRATADGRGHVEEYYDKGQAVVCCPWHGIEFDLETGTCLADTSRRIATYDVTVEGGRISVEVP